MKNVLLLSLLIWALTSCQEIPEDLKKELRPDEKVDPVTDSEKDVTDLSVCRGPVPVGQSLVGKYFRLDLESTNGFQIQDVFYFDKNQVSLSRTCYTDSLQTTVVARANSSVTLSEVQIFTSDSQKDWIAVDGNKFPCTASLRAGQWISYSFVGKCLKAKFGKHNRTLIPY